MQILYKINNNKDYGVYCFKETVDEKFVREVRRKIAQSNSLPIAKVKVIVVDSDRVIKADPKITKEERSSIRKRMEYSFAKGV